MSPALIVTVTAATFAPPLLGLKLTVIGHDAPGAIEPGQAWVRAKLDALVPVTLIDVSGNAAWPVFDNVMTCGAEIWPTVVPPKASAAGESA